MLEFFERPCSRNTQLRAFHAERGRIVLGGERWKVRALGVIPARYGSTRFEGKVLAPLGDKPLFAHVAMHARESKTLSRILVATEDERVVKAARAEGVEAMLSPPTLTSGSDRVAFAIDRLEAEGERYEVVVNLQADEPFLPGSAADRAVRLLEEDPGAAMGTLAVPMDSDASMDPHAVKVVLDRRGRALYFSRSAVPHGSGTKTAPFLRHIGLYAFRRAYLRRFVELGPSPLETLERLEQLRALEDGAVIRVAVGNWPALSVDTREDLARAERFLERMLTHEGGGA
jgi:3-deoxy-manno-octulosonate cytidylyltransferase (CMP-KDO synthetase)